ncbi:hypothetical protein [Pantoea vagans]|nr:hypothetical protein [Pantoea agglomerans]
MGGRWVTNQKMHAVQFSPASTKFTDINSGHLRQPAV